MKTTSKALGYIRITNPNLLDSPTQEAAITEFAKARRLEIVGFFIDKGMSRQGINLPGLKQLIRKVAKEPIESIVVYDDTRISRKNSEYREIRDTLLGLGVKIHTVNQEIFPWSPMDEFLEAMQRSMGQLDYQQRVDMVKRRMQERAEQGFSMQRPPLGYSRSFIPGLFDKNVTADALSYYFKQTLNGEMNAYELRKAVSRIYSETKTISKKRLLKIASNPFYSGYVSYDGKLYRGQHNPLMTEQDQNKLLDILSN